MRVFAAIMRESLMSRIKTSVIIPVYNTEKFLPQCLDSVIDQSQKEIEIIAIDDGSTDHSLEILYDYQRRYHNIYVCSQTNMRQGVARNVGLKKAKGEYVYFLDSDDFIDPETLEECYIRAEHKRLDVVLFDSKVIVEGKFSDEFQADDFDRRNIIKETDCVYSGLKFLELYMDSQPDTVSPCMMYISRQFLNKNALFFMPYVYYEDEEFRFNLMQKAERIMYIPQLYYNRRYRNNSTMTVNYDEKRNIDLAKVIKQMLRDVTEQGSPILKRYIVKKMWMLLDRCNLMRNKNASGDLIEEIQQLLCLFWDIFVLPWDIEDIKFRIFYIDYLKRIFRDVDWSEEEKKSNEQRRVLLRKIPLGQKSAKIGIYGREDLIDRLCWGYRNECGEIVAEIFKLVVGRAENEQHEMSFNSAAIVNLEYILLISGEKQGYILKCIQQNLNPNTKVLCLGDEEGNFIF